MSCMLIAYEYFWDLKRLAQFLWVKCYKDPDLVDENKAVRVADSAASIFLHKMPISITFGVTRDEKEQNQSEDHEMQSAWYLN